MTNPEPTRSSEEVLKLLIEAEKVAAELREELLLLRQYEALDHLPELLDAEKTSWSNLVPLMKEALADLRAKRKGNEDAQ